MGGSAAAPSLARGHVELSERDRALFLGLFEAGVMIRNQIAELYFSGSYEAAGKRIQKLLRYGYLRERPLPGRPGVYVSSWLTLGARAFGVLSEEGLLPERASWESVRDRLARSSVTLAHDLGVVDLWVAFEKAARASPTYSVKRFSTCPSEFRFDIQSRQGELIPDAFAVLAYVDDPSLPPIESALFFEWDRSTESRSVLRAKAAGYDTFYRSGNFALRCGGRAECAEDYPFRTVFVVRNEERRNNLLEEFGRETAKGALIPDQFWCTTWQEILTDPFGPIYLHVADYLSATEGSLYDPERHVTKYRVRDRDAFVGEWAHKRRLFE